MSLRVSVRQAVVCALFCALPLGFQVNAAMGMGAASAKQNVNSDRLIIRFNDSTPFSKASQILKRLEQQHGEKIQFVRESVNQALVFKFESGKSRQEWAKLQRWLRSTNTVEYVEVDEILQPMAVTPDDAYFQYQWPLTEATGGINVQPSWGQSVSGKGIVVAVIDTGYLPHEDLTPNLIAGYDMIADSFVANDGNGRDSDASDPGDYVLAGECGATSDYSSSWHGTHVAGTVAAAANNQTGIAGVAYNAKIQPVRTLGKCGGYTSDIADSVLWASGNSVSGAPVNPTPARVLNLSLGGSGHCSRTMQRAVDRAVSNNSVVVVAAGNSNTDAGQFTPANCKNVITVASTSREGGKAYYSNTGSVVDIAAPGGSMLNSSYDGILSTLNTGSTQPEADTYSFYQGTSMAAPHVAGVAALMLSANPDLTATEVETILKDNARAFLTACTGCGTGIVDASAAVSVAISLTGGDTGTSNMAPDADFIFSANNLSVQFNDSSSDNDGSIASWQWDFGDGNRSTAQNPNHSYATAGTYTVNLTVADNNGATDSYSQSVNVLAPTINNAPTAGFTVSISDLSIQLTDSSNDSDGSIASWQWDFGDGNHSTVQSPGHSYVIAGTYTVNLTVTDNGGATDSYSQSIEVSPGLAPAITLDVNAYKVKGRQKVDLSWSEATSEKVDVFRNGTKQFTTANDGSETDAINRRGGGGYLYQICETGTEICSAPVTANF